MRNVEAKRSLSPARSGRAPVPAAVPPTSPQPETLFRPRDVQALLGVSRRQLQYWAQTGLVEPSARTPGGHHRYTFPDLVALRAVVRLMDAGVSLQRIRRGLAALTSALPGIDRPLAELVLVVTGDVVLVFGEETAFEAVSGQEWIFPVARFQRDVESFLRASAARPARGVRPVRREPRAADTG